MKVSFVSRVCLAFWDTNGFFGTAMFGLEGEVWVDKELMLDHVCVTVNKL